MLKKFSYLIFSILNFFDRILKILTKKSYLIWFNDFIQEKSYQSVKILDKEIKFFCPNQFTKWRIDTFFTKEPEILNGNSFEKRMVNFWDITKHRYIFNI